MLLITLYHFLEVNAQDNDDKTSNISGLVDEKTGVGAVKPQALAATVARAREGSVSVKS